MAACYLRRPRLSRAFLGGNRFNKGLDADDAKVVAHVVSVSTVLTELDVGGNAIGDLGVAAIAQALPFSPALTVVSLGANAIGDAGAVAVGEALRINTVLTTVSLGGNVIGDKGAAAIAEALKTNTVLKELVIGSSIGAAGASALSEALKVNKALKELSLTGSLGDAGAIALAGALRVNVALTALDVRHNSIGTEGGKAIAEALEVSGGAGTRVLELTLMGNSIGDAGIAAIGKVLLPNAITAPHLRAQAGKSSARVAAAWI